MCKADDYSIHPGCRKSLRNPRYVNTTGYLPFPSPRLFMHSFENELFVIEQSYHYPIQIFDTTTERWRIICTERYDCCKGDIPNQCPPFFDGYGTGPPITATAAFEDTFVVLYGQGEPSNPYQLGGDIGPLTSFDPLPGGGVSVYMFNMTTFEWSAVCRLDTLKRRTTCGPFNPYLRFYEQTQMTILDGRLYLFGGNVRMNGVQTWQHHIGNDLWTLDLVSPNPTWKVVCRGTVFITTTNEHLDIVSGIPSDIKCSYHGCEAVNLHELAEQFSDFEAPVCNPNPHEVAAAMFTTVDRPSANDRVLIMYGGYTNSEHDPSDFQSIWLFGKCTQDDHDVVILFYFCS